MEELLKNAVVLEVDGPDVHPGTADAPAILDLASAFFGLMQGAVKEDSAELTFKGLHIVDKCMAIVVPVNNVSLAKMYAEDAHEMIRVSDSEVAKRARGALKRLGEGISVKVAADGWERAIELPVRAVRPVDSILCMRARPVRAGGAHPTVRFEGLGEEPFTLSVTAEQARSLGSLLYREVEIVADVTRNVDFTIDRGRLRSFEEVADVDPVPLWRDWYRSVGGDEWDRIVDIEAELGR